MPSTLSAGPRRPTSSASTSSQARKPSSNGRTPLGSIGEPQSPPRIDAVFAPIKPGSRQPTARKPSGPPSNRRPAREEEDDEEGGEEDDKDDGDFDENVNSQNRQPSQTQSQSQSSQNGRKVSSALAKAASKQAAARNDSQSSSTTGQARGALSKSVLGRSHKRVSAIGLPEQQVPKISVDSTSFEEWMKMATDNKINATNTWNFALIDYFHDMSLLRSDSGDGSINFQKASCTLDGCVKVWTSRVDSVVVETGKLLSGLQDEINAGKEKSGRNKDGDEDDGSDLDGDEGENGASGASGSNKKKRNRAREATLAKNFSQIQLKKFDLEFTVDPLFKKTSADFDEGGAGGLLMNHLGVDGKMRVVFDAGDVAGIVEDGEEEGGATTSGALPETMEDVSGDATEEHEALTPTAAADASQQVDLGKIRSKLFGTSTDPSEGIQALLSGLSICPSLGSFRFSKEDKTLFGAQLADEDGEDAPIAPPLSMNDAGLDFGDDGLPMDDGEAGGIDFFADGGGAGGDGYSDGGDFEGDPAWGGYAAAGEDAGPSQSGRPGDLMSMAFVVGQAGEGDDGAEGTGMFDYFDQKLMKNWAGPEHWKMRRAFPSSLANRNASGVIGEDGLPTSSQGNGKNTRKSKEPFVIDFLSEEAAVPSKELFEAASSGRGSGGITLPQQRAGGTRDAYLLPEDQHFSSKQLLRLFVKPKMTLNLRRRGPGRVQLQDAPAEIDEGFWAQAAAAREQGLGDADESGAGSMPFDTQFFHDADDGYGDDDALPMGEATVDGITTGGLGANGEGEELAGQALKRIKPEFVNYAKKAKRVDVKKLKENIWKQLDIDVTGDGRPELDREAETEEEDGPTTPKKESQATVGSDSNVGPAKKFNNVLTGLRKTYARDRMEEISTSFCFICILHLANEEGLKLDTGNGSVGKKGLDPRNPSGLSAFAKGRGSTATSVRGGGGGGRMSVLRADDDDDRLGAPGDGEEDEMAGWQEGEDEEDLARIGQLELLNIAKDFTAGRSA